MLDIALKEWAIVCDLLLEGKLALLLRKGGIHESGGPGVFELEHPRFLLFPSWAHQKPEMMKPEFSKCTQVLAEPATVTFRGIGEVTRIWQVRERATLDALQDLHCWTAAQIDMRFNYKPQNPLYVMAVRTLRLPGQKTVANSAAYGGCKSWVPLAPADAVDDRGTQPVLDSAALDGVIHRLDKVLA